MMAAREGNVMKDIRIGIRLDATTHAIVNHLAPEGNVSMWIRALIRKELRNVANVSNVNAARLIEAVLSVEGFKANFSDILSSIDAARPEESKSFDFETAINSFKCELEADADMKRQREELERSEGK